MERDFATWSRSVLAGLLVLFALLIFQTVWWKALVVSMICYVLCVQGFGKRWIERIAFVLAFYAVATWIDAFPDPSELKGAILDAYKRVLG
jgi:hypothetical protein